MWILRTVLLGGLAGALIASPAMTQSTAASGRPRTNTELVSVSFRGTVGNESSGSPSISANGRYVAFSSSASNLVRGRADDNGGVFVRDRWTRTTTLVSLSNSGRPADGANSHPAISANGRYIAFLSTATNLGPGTGEEQAQVFIRDRWAGRTTLVSVSDTGEPANNYIGGHLAISGNGRYVAFDSLANNLVPGDANNDYDVFVRDWWAGRTTRVSVSSTGVESDSQSVFPSLSADGRYVTFQSFAETLVPGDTNREQDIFIHDRRRHTTSLVSLTSDGEEAGGSVAMISASGRYVTFTSASPRLVPEGSPGGIFVRDRHTGITSRVSLSNTGEAPRGTCWGSAISADGRYVIFECDAGNLVPGDTNDVNDIFLRDRRTAKTTLVSQSVTGGPPDTFSGGGVISADGRFAAYDTWATNIVPRDTNDKSDVFLRRIR